MAVFDIFMRLRWQEAGRTAFTDFAEMGKRVHRQSAQSMYFRGRDFLRVRERAPVFVELRTHTFHPGKPPELTRAPAEHGAPW
jgi:hypothetical protein